MSINVYLEEPRVVQEIDALKKHFAEHPLHISDIEDEYGHQYVDLVQEGGGVLGIALVGYTYALEQLGIRFFSLAGTSAGAINTALLACVARPHEEKSTTILKILDDTNLMDFIDGGRDAKRLVKKMAGSGGMGATAFTALNQLDDFMRGELGINRGKVFFKWLEELFYKFGTPTTAQLSAKMNDFPPLMIANLKDKFKDTINDADAFTAQLAIIASDLTTQTKADFPRMAPLYFHHPEEISPAYFVRASMAIPIFFDPLVVEELPQGIEQVRKWQDIDMAYYFGNIPSKVVFVDGGIMSNFPIDIFHTSERAPTRPTFGVKLGIDRTSANENDSIFNIIWNSFSAARQMRDLDVILKNKDFINLITPIDDKGTNWLNFNLSQKEKVELFKQGVIAGCMFLKNFDWEGYKKIRKNLNKTNKELESNKKEERNSIEMFFKKM